MIWFAFLRSSEWDERCVLIPRKSSVLTYNSDSMTCGCLRIRMTTVTIRGLSRSCSVITREALKYQARSNPTPLGYKVHLPITNILDIGLTSKPGYLTHCSWSQGTSLFSKADTHLEATSCDSLPTSHSRSATHNKSNESMPENSA